MLGKTIRQLRNEKGITQSDLSNIVGLTPKMISFYELGQRFPPHDIIIKLADYFDVSTDYLLGISDIRNPEKILIPYQKLYESEQTYPQKGKSRDALPSDSDISSLNNPLEMKLIAMYRCLNEQDKKEVYMEIERRYKRK